MRALVVYESMFGNTKSVAQAIAEGLSNYLPTEIREVGSAPVNIDSEIELVAVGGPTHAFGMTRPGTRADAARQTAGHPVSAGIGIREWLEQMHADPNVTTFAAFGTKVGLPLPGSASKAADRALRDRGFHISRPPASFRVHGTPGPLHDGETERARRWGAELGIGTHNRSTARDQQAQT